MNLASQNVVKEPVPGDLLDLENKFLEEVARRPTVEEIERWNEEFKDRQGELCVQDKLDESCTRTLNEKTARVRRVLGLNEETQWTLLNACLETQQQPPASSNTTSTNSTNSSINDVNGVQASKTLTTTTRSSAPSSTSKAAGNIRMGQQNSPEANAGSSEPTISSKKPQLVEEVDRLTKEVETSKKLVAESSEMLKQVQRQLDKAEKKLEGVYTSFSTRKITYLSPQGLLAEISHTAKLNQECDNFRRDNQDLRWSNKELTDKLEARERELKEREADWSTAQKTKSEELEAVKERERKLEDQVKVTVEELKGSNIAREAVRTELEKCKLEKETLKVDLEKEKSASMEIRQRGYKAVREAVAIYEANTVKWYGEKKTLQEKIKDQEETIVRLHEASKSEDDDLERVMELQSQTAELERAKSKVSRADKKAEQDEENLRGLQAELDRQGSKLGGLHPAAFFQFLTTLRAEKLSNKVRTLGTDFAQVRIRFAGGNFPVTEVLETCDNLGGRTLSISYVLEDLAASSKAVSFKSIATSPRLARKSISTSKVISTTSTRGTGPLQLESTPPPPSSSAPGKPSSSRPIKRPTTLPSARGTDPLQLQQPTPPPTGTSRSTASQLPSSSSSSSSKQPSSSTQPPSSKPASAISTPRPPAPSQAPVAGSSMSGPQTPARPEPPPDPDSCKDSSEDLLETKRPSSPSRQKRGQVVSSEPLSDGEGNDKVEKPHEISQKPSSVPKMRKQPMPPPHIADASAPSSRDPGPSRLRADVESSSDESMYLTEIKRSSSQNPTRSKQKRKQTVLSDPSSSEGENETLRVGSGNPSSKFTISREKLVTNPELHKQPVPSSLTPQRKGDADSRTRPKVTPSDARDRSSATLASSTSAVGNKTFTSPRKRQWIEDILMKVPRTQSDPTASATGKVVSTSPRKRRRVKEASGVQSRRDDCGII
ncbi:hypothetical protein PQX77_016503 [Marasmius sp. AFHP31]|nr:hypothetical protein PQX77_016503 [Marasmius sp. AFHP31]